MAVEDDARRFAEAVKGRALALGFDLAGIAPAGESAYREYFARWLASGAAGEMEYLARRFEERADPRVYLPAAKSVVCVAVNYHVSLEEPAAPGRIARYALGDDYHDLIKRRLYELADWMRQTLGGDTKVAVDTAPVMEKELAMRAGIGWMGKNTCIIHPRIGSWLLLGEVLTTLELAPDAPATDHCRNCRRCIEACPTQAITESYRLDARRCISYLTIEHRSEIAPELREKIGDWLYGCDICQEVCPFNREAPTTTWPEMKPRFPSGGLNPEEVFHWEPETFSRALRASAIKRVKLPVLQRNAAIVRDNAARQSIR